MNDRNLVRGLLLAAIALGFGIGALNYKVGDFARAGPGLFPLMVSVILLVIALAMIVRSRFDTPRPLAFNPRNIALILGSLVAFSLASHFVNMTLGIVCMVFVASLAGRAPSWKLNLKVAAGLVAVAFAFKELLGLNLPLI